MARPKNPENKYEPRHAKLGVPVLDKDGNLLTFETKAAADVTPEDIKKVLSFFDAKAEEDSAFNVETAIDGVFKLKEEVSEQPAKLKTKGKSVNADKGKVSDPPAEDKEQNDDVNPDKDKVSDEESEEEEETNDDNSGDKPNE